jgi:Kef-type K+ transport system membrane component KefB
MEVTKFPALPDDGPLPMPLEGRGSLTFYLGVLVLGALGVFGALHAGSALQSGGPSLGFGSGSEHSGISMLARFLVALAAIMAGSQALGWVCRRIGQPPVMGEVVGGILLGPSFLGWVWPAGYAGLLPASIVPALGVVAKLGVILYMFFVGVELDPSHVRRQGRATAMISHASMVLPFTLGCLLSLILYPRYSGADVPFHVFALFVGASMSVTAFPVLARILTDQNMHRTPLGALAISCSAVDDVTAWCMLATVVSVATASPWVGLRTVLLTGAFVAFVLTVVAARVRRLAAACEERPEKLSSALAELLVIVVLAACATEAIGIHALFGAFAVGTTVPCRSRLAGAVLASLWDLVSVMLLPCFFAFTGMKTHFGLVQGAGDWAIVALVIVVASVGKFFGSYWTARWCGLSRRDAGVLGILMNTRGLMELIVLTLGLELKILTPQLYAILVLMALVTTFATTPIVRWLRPPAPVPQTGSGASRAAM